MKADKPKMRHFQRIEVESIYYLQTFEKKTLMVSPSGQRRIIGMPLSRFEKMIESNNQFIRISKRNIVNRIFIKNIGDGYVIMSNGLTLPKTMNFTSNDE